MTPAAEPPPALEALLRGPGRRLSFQPDGRLKCSLTGHVMKADEAVVSAHVSGAKYTRRAADADECEQLAAQEPSLTKSRNFEGKWYCSLTCHVISATPASLRRHLEGKKLALARALAAKGEHEPVSEPELEEEEKEEEEEEEEEGEEEKEGSEGEMGASGEEEAEEAGGSGRARGAAGGAAAAAAKGKKNKSKKAASAAAAAAAPPKTPEETKGKGSRAQDASRPSRPKRARRAPA